MRVLRKHLLTPGGGGGGTQQTFLRGSSATRSNPLPFYIPFFAKKVPPVRIPFIDKWYPFHIPCLELCTLLTAVNALSFK